MDGLYEIVTVCVPTEFGGREWRIGPLRLVDYAEIERRVLQRHRPPLAFDEAGRADRATSEELQAWLRSDAGILFELWLRLRSAQPATTLANVEELFADRVAEVSVKMADAALRTGEYPLGSELSCERESTAGRKPIPWRLIFRRLIRASVSPESVGTLTPVQLQIILLRTADQGEIVQLSLAEAEELLADRSRRRDRWIEEQLAESRRSLDPAHRGIVVLATIADGLTNSCETLPPASDPPDATDDEPNLHGAIRDLVNRIDEMLAKSRRPNSILDFDPVSRFADGP